MMEASTAIMDAAEKRMRRGGFSGFSFREIATDVGIKSSSVHYHFPTKEDLAAAVIRRYTERAAVKFDSRLQAETDPLKVWVSIFRETLHSDEGMCPCSVLAASLQDLPEQVSLEVKGFFEMCIEKMVKQRISKKQAYEILSAIAGAQLISNALGDNSVYDNAVSELLQMHQKQLARSGKQSKRQSK